MPNTPLPEPTPTPLVGPAPELVAAWAGFLAAHEQGAAAGAPLLTAAGVSHVWRLLLAASPAAGGPALPAPLPRWDESGRRLWQGSRLLKEFRKPAPYQVALLAAFEEEGWAVGRIDDPLPPEPGDGPEEIRKRLRETVHNLNRGLPDGTIRFHGDGTGEGVWWEWCGPAELLSNLEQEKYES